jgi:hypothetical protein
LGALIANTHLNAKIAGAIAPDTAGYLDINFKGVLDGNPQGTENRQMTTPLKYILADTATLGVAQSDALVITLADGIALSLDADGTD